MSDLQFFPPDYATARSQFEEAARCRGARWEELPLAARGPSGESLGINVAWLGAANPRRVVLHSSGLHGIEGFAGSAIQRKLLAHLPAIPDDTAVVFFHVLNPYGMAWLRRFNENNVDLNRNFLAPDEFFQGASAAYRQLSPVLNPPSPPRGVSLFLARAAWNVARFGLQNLKQTIAEGQYEFPQGLFFGGQRLEATAVAVVDWWRRRLSGAEEIFAIDVHTGLGERGHDTLLTHHDPTSSKGQHLRQRLGYRVKSWHSTGVAYQIRGGFLDALERELGASRVTGVYQEFGTHSSVKVLHALREENRLHHWGDPRDLQHPAKRRLLEAFCPRDPEWRRRVLERGQSLFTAVLTQGS